MIVVHDWITYLQYNILYQLALVRIIGIEMEATAFLPEVGPFYDEVANRDHIAQLT